ncbi:hypothetical protein OROHE_003742 [Orobanche hederae]
MEWIEETVASIKSIQLRQALHQAVTLDGTHEPDGTGVAMNSYLNLMVRVRFLGKANAERRSIRHQHNSGSQLGARSKFSHVGETIFDYFLQKMSCMIVASALMIWKTLICITGSESPVVVILSESMEPGFARVRRHFVLAYEPKLLCTTLICGRDIPTVHRVIEVHERQDTGEVDILTKGDNNDGDDIPLYAPGQLWLKRQHIMGRAVGILTSRRLGHHIMTEKPLIKFLQYILIGVLGLLVITSKERLMDTKPNNRIGNSLLLLLFSLLKTVHRLV